MKQAVRQSNTHLYNHNNNFFNGVKNNEITNNEKHLLENAFSSNNGWREKEFDAMIQRVQSEVMNTIDKHNAQQQFNLGQQQQTRLPNLPSSMNHLKSMPLPTVNNMMNHYSTKINNDNSKHVGNDYQASSSSPPGILKSSRRENAIQNIKKEREIKMKLRDTQALQDNNSRRLEMAYKNLAARKKHGNKIRER